MAETKATKAESGVTADMMEAAAADLKEKNEKREAEKQLRVFRPGGVQSQLYVSKVFKLPEDFSLDNLSPTSYLAQPEGEITGSVSTQRYSLVEERLKGLVFDQPGRPLAAGRALRTVKWLKPDGTLSQIGYEGQINNTAAGDLSDAIGLRGYARKGGVMFFNFDTGLPIYCFARNCWAAAMCEEIADDFPQHRGVIGSGYCSADHFRFVEPGRARRWFQEGTGFDFNATTTKNAMR